MSNRFLASGAYGCVYNPSYDCDGREIDNATTVTKLVKNNLTSQEEIKIGKVLRKYPNDFILVSKSCKISNDRLKQSTMIPRCDLFKRNADITQNYILLYSKYVKSIEFIDYLEKTYPSKNEVIKMFLLICKKVHILSINNIIHHDLHFGNILVDGDKNLFVIDFGLSIMYKKINDYLYFFNKIKKKTIVEKNLQKLQNIKSYITRCIFPFTPTWKYWSLEYQFMCFVYYEQEYLTKESVKYVIDEYIDNNSIIQKIGKSFVDNYKVTANEFFSIYVDNPAFTTKYDILIDLFKYWYTWDYYKVALHYIEIYNDIHLNSIDFYLLLLLFINPNPRYRPSLHQYDIYIDIFKKHYNSTSLQMSINKISPKIYRNLAISIKTLIKKKVNKIEL